MFGNLMAIYHIMLQFIQNPSLSVCYAHDLKIIHIFIILNGFSCLMCLFRLIFL